MWGAAVCTGRAVSTGEGNVYGGEYFIWGVFVCTWRAVCMGESILYGGWVYLESSVYGGEQSVKGELCVRAG